MSEHVKKGAELRALCVESIYRDMIEALKCEIDFDALISDVDLGLGISGDFERDVEDAYSAILQQLKAVVIERIDNELLSVIRTDGLGEQEGDLINIMQNAMDNLSQINAIPKIMMTKAAYDDLVNALGDDASLDHIEVVEGVIDACS